MSFCLTGWRSSLLLAFYRLKSIKRKNKSNVLQAG
jgi:hypothetical protein